MNFFELASLFLQLRFTFKCCSNYNANADVKVNSLVSLKIWNTTSFIDLWTISLILDRIWIFVEFSILMIEIDLKDSREELTNPVFSHFHTFPADSD